MAIPVCDGWAQTEVATELGTSECWVSARLDELRDELAALAATLK